MKKPFAKALVVDVGNTSTAIGVLSNGRIRDVVHCDGGFKDASEAAKKIVAKDRAISRVVYVSVVPSMDRRWHDWSRECRLSWHKLGYGDFVRHIRLDYPEPATIGVDRLCDALGAVTKYGFPVLVMDFGTALTAAVVTADRRTRQPVWRGGVIAPGFPLMRDYLFERTAKLPRMQLGSGRVPKIGRSTEQAMQFGARVGYRGMVREIVATLQKNFKVNFRLIATGGFAKWVLDGLDLEFTIDPTLTLYGAGLCDALS